MKQLPFMLWLLALTAGEAAAQKTEFRSIHELPGASRRVDVDLVDAPAVDAFQTFAEVLGASLEVDPAVDGLVTARLERVTVATAIRAISESLDLQFALVMTPGGPPILRLEPAEQTEEGAAPRRRAVREPRNVGTNQLISLSLAGAALRDVLSSFGRILGAEVDLPPDLEGSLTLEMQEAPAGDALDQICRQFDLTWRIVEEPGSQASRRRLEIRRLER
jgi:type II secretory pathway component GspD/PulD (secretin)